MEWNEDKYVVHGGGALRDDPRGQYLPNQKIEKLPHATHLFAEEAKAF